MSLLLFWAHRTLNYARKTVGGEFLIPVYCQAGEEVGRAPHWTLFATLTLAKTNIRGRETFFLTFIPSLGHVRYLTSLGLSGQKACLSHRKAYRGSLTASIFFFKLSWMQPKRCWEKREWGGAGQGETGVYCFCYPWQWVAFLTLFPSPSLPLRCLDGIII